MQFNTNFLMGIIYNQGVEMGLLGNKDTKGSTKEITPPKAPENPPPAIIAPEKNDIKSTLEDWVDTTKSFFNSWSSKTCDWCESDSFKELSRSRKEFATQYCHPLGNFYRELPLQITSWKLKLTEKYSQKERLFTLQALTLLVAVSTLRAKRDLGLNKRFLFSIRNSTIAFLLGGLLFVPEIYNPLIKSDF